MNKNKLFKLFIILNPSNFIFKSDYLKIDSNCTENIYNGNNHYNNDGFIRLYFEVIIFT